MKKIFILLFGIVLVGNVHGVTIHGSDSADGDKKGLFLEVKADAFVCDAEYFLPRSKGYTYVGSRLLPSLCYVVNDQVQLHGGVLLTALAGHEGLWKVEPVLTFDFSPTRWLLIRMGTLESDNQHMLGAPMIDPNRWYYAYKEDGMQIQTHTTHWESDTWLDWEHFLEPWTADQERFTLGTRHELFLFNHRQTERQHWQVSLPMSFVGTHRGGQISTLDTCIETIFNEQVGLRATWLGEHVVFGIEVPLYLYQNGSPKNERHRPFDQGWGVWPNAHLAADWRRNQVMVTVGFWRGCQYLSSLGNALFMSISDHDDYIQPDVHLATIKMEYLYRHKDFSFGINAQSYYDTDHQKMDLDIGIVMRFFFERPLKLRQ